MIKIPSFQGIEISKTEYNQLINEIKNISGFTTHKLENSYGGRDIYGFSYGDIINKPCIMIIGQIHGGHEWRTTHWVKRFMEIIGNSNGLAQNKIIQNLKGKYSFYFIPCVNPDGYVNTTYTNDNGVGLNYNFDYMWNDIPFNEGTTQYKGSAPFSESETRNIRDIVLKIKPISFISCHTWGGDYGIKIRHPQNLSLDLLITDYFNSSVLTSNVIGKQGVKLEPRNLVPTEYNWVGEQIGKMGKKTMANVLETGSSETDIEQSRLGLNALLLHCVYVDNWLTNNTLTINKL